MTVLRYCARISLRTGTIITGFYQLFYVVFMTYLIITGVDKSFFLYIEIAAAITSSVLVLLLAGVFLRKKWLMWPYLIVCPIAIFLLLCLTIVQVLKSEIITTIILSIHIGVIIYLYFVVISYYQTMELDRVWLSQQPSMSASFSATLRDIPSGQVTLMDSPDYINGLPYRLEEAKPLRF